MDNARYDIIPPKVLDAVQMSHIFPDSKTFVDKPLRATTDEISQAFNALPQPLSTKHLKEFVEKYFDEEGNDLESIVPTDFNESPKFLETIEDNRLKKFAFSLNQKWKNLGMKIKPGVQWSGKKNSLLYMPHPFIVPGGRFREIYYWDSFWVMKGLLVCDMTETVKGMLGNMLFMVDKYGFIPNGNREYYKNRSQPPLLIPMVHIYLEKTGDIDFLRKNFKLLEKEYNFWVTNRSVSVKVEDQVYEASMYRVATDSPRPESYREDKTLALSNPAAPAGQLYADLASAAESGWDFSTRWFKINRPITELDSIATRDIVPVDLNAFLCWNARLLRDFSQILGNTDRVTHYSSEYLRRLTLIDALFWDETAGAWFDYHLGSEARDVRFYASMITPMFTDCHGLTTAEKEGKVQRVMNYVKRTLGNFEGYQAGVPTSLFMSGQQWDYPNAWPPLQHMWIHSFHQSKNPEANNLASSLAEKWVTSNYMKWRPKQYMYEKYNAVTGEVGYGGEYQVQEGFGWSNGVILDLLSTFPKLTLPQNLIEVTVEADAVVSVSKLS